MTDRKIDYVALDEIRRDPRNPKAHNDALIEASIGRLGFMDPALLDERTGLLIGGHGRLDALEAAHARGDQPPDGIRKLRDGRWAMPVVRGWASADDAEAARALVVLNRATELGGWQPEPLRALLADLPDLELTGWASLDDLPPLPDLIPVSAHDRNRPDDDDDNLPVEVSRRVDQGDVWALGAHRLICGDCRDSDVVKRLLDGSVVNVAFTSPPYADRRKYDETSGFTPIPPDEYVEWFAPVAANVADHLAEDGSWFVNVKPGSHELDRETYVLDLILAHVRAWGWHSAEEYCWERNGVPKHAIQRFKNQWESVHQFTRGRWKFRPDSVRHWSENVPTPGGPGVGATTWDGRQGNADRRAISNGTFTRHQGTTGEFFAGDAVPGLAYPGNRLPTFAGSHEATGHTAAFPTGLPGFFVRAYSDEGDTVFDPFCGSGSTLIAAEREGRIGFGCEISPGYCDVIVARWERHSGQVAVRVDGPEKPAR